MIVEFDNLNYRYPSSHVQVFRDLSCGISKPGFHALFGPSGVGKTTLAKMTAGLIGGYSGKIEYGEETEILYTYNLERLPGWSDVREHLLQISPPEKGEEIERLAEFFKIGECLDKKFSNLSLGQQNRVNLTRYLLQKFDLLIMDESLANVDEATRQFIILKIKSMFSGKAFLYISHNVAEVARYCDDILVLRDARKTPQVTRVKGVDRQDEQEPDSGDIERIMLEIVHAS